MDSPVHDNTQCVCTEILASPSFEGNIRCLSSGMVDSKDILPIFNGSYLETELENFSLECHPAWIREAIKKSSIRLLQKYNIKAMPFWVADAIGTLIDDRGVPQSTLDLEQLLYSWTPKIATTCEFNDDMDMNLVNGNITVCCGCGKKEFTGQYTYDLCGDCDKHYSETHIDRDEYEHEEHEMCFERCIDCGDYDCEGNGACGMYRGFAIPPEPCDCCMHMNCVCNMYDSDSDDSFR